MKIAQRIPTPLYYEEANYQKLVEFLEEHRPCFDELTLFTSFSAHGAIPLDILRSQAEVIKIRVADLKKRGFKSVGLNVQVTVGHLDEDYEIYGQPFTPFTGYKGDKSKACFCPESPEMKAYLCEKYQIFAKTEPDFLWLDDDIKFFWNGIKFGCFCPNCMARFNRKMNTNYDRESLVAAMEEPDAVELRAAWVQDIGARMTDLFVMIKDAIREVAPGLRLGLQTQRQDWSTYNTWDFATWFPALDACMARPGEGFYDDKTPSNICTKALATARQAAEYPASVTDVQYELEDFPTYSTMQKSRAINLDECTLAVAQGMNGVLLNSFPTSNMIMEMDLGRLYEDIAQIRYNWDQMELYGRDMHGVGFYPAVSTKYDQRRPLHNGESFFVTYDETLNHDVTPTYRLSHIGVPLTVEPEHAYGAIFTGDLPDGFTDEELIGFLSRSVIVDHKALRAFERRGLGKYLGVRCVSEDLTDGICEVFSGSEINSGIVGYKRNVHPAYFGGSGAILEVLDDNVEAISYMYSPLEGKKLGIAASLYENSLGGKVCVLGYAAYQRVDSLARLIQMQRVASYLAGDTELTRFQKPCLAAQFVRTDGKRTMATIINLSMDSLDPMPYAVRNAHKARILHNGTESVVSAETKEQFGIFQLPELRPYETCTLLVE